MSLFERGAIGSDSFIRSVLRRAILRRAVIASGPRAAWDDLPQLHPSCSLWIETVTARLRPRIGQTVPRRLIPRTDVRLFPDRSVNR